MNYGFVIDNRRCIGCHACTVACKAEHDVPLGVNRTWVKYIEKGTFPDTRRFFSVLRCNHCEDAPCVTICPVTALFTRQDGIVDFDPNRCIGCKACMQACPYDALHIDPRTDTAAKCNFCAHRIEASLEPPCVVVCPERAIIAGDMDDPAAEITRILQIEKVSVRKPEKGTRPKVFYIDADQASLVPGATVVPTTYVSSEAREPGVAPRAPSGGGHAGRDEEKEARRVYDTGQTHQDSWGWKVSAYLFTKSIASGCLILTPFLWGWGNPAYEARLRLAALTICLILLGVTGALLVADLKRPGRFLWVLTRPQWRSWLTRGSYILLAFGAVATGLLAAHQLGLRALWNALALPAVALGAAAACYTAFLFWQSKGRDLWQSPLLPLHLLVQALIAGLSSLLLFRAASPEPLPSGEGALEGWLWRLLLANAAMIVIELTAIHQTQDATAAARWARVGRPGRTLLWGVMACGHAIPLALLMIPSVAAAAAASV
ncbi:MAG TPA: 4Fe-4S dicluster domain-containing protein, partial [Candidatus Polarisedimenticolia bacterium]|nr:4Fe-4S dicluster domain-containing protein [Candidatus Polarisedimenticolia bacterium]